MTHMTTGDAGQYAENLAARFLEERGHHIIARNFRTRYGEIDLVTERDEYLCFVEVRARGRGGSHRAAASVGSGKRGRVLRAAQQFLAEYRGRAQQPRFDVVAVGFGRFDDKVRYYEGAYRFDDF